MTHNEKVKALIDRLSVFLRIYTPPRTMDAEEQAKAILGIAESIAKKIAPRDESALHETIDRTLEAVADHHESYAWPPQASFVKHIAYSAAPMAVAVHTAQETISIVAARMRAGDPVGDRFVFGAGADEVRDIVGADVVERYRKGVGIAFRRSYGERAPEMMRIKYGEWAVRYV